SLGGAYSTAVVFFFRAEDGIRDFHVTGVQTCALPILPLSWPSRAWLPLDRLGHESGIHIMFEGRLTDRTLEHEYLICQFHGIPRSEERRVGQECRWRRSRHP